MSEERLSDLLMLSLESERGRNLVGNFCAQRHV